MLAGIADTNTYIFMRTHYQLQLEQFSVAAAGVELHSLLGESAYVATCACVVFGRITAVDSLFSPAPSGALRRGFA